MGVSKPENYEPEGSEDTNNGSDEVKVEPWDNEDEDSVCGSSKPENVEQEVVADTDGETEEVKAEVELWKVEGVKEW